MKMEATLLIMKLNEQQVELLLNGYGILNKKLRFSNKTFFFLLQETNKDQPGKNTITVLEAHQQFSGSTLGHRTSNKGLVVGSDQQQFTTTSSITDLKYVNPDKHLKLTLNHLPKKISFLGQIVKVYLTHCYSIRSNL